jgi:hypothetical protein
MIIILNFLQALIDGLAQRADAIHFSPTEEWCVLAKLR